MNWESWCPVCDGFLLGGEHFEGRRCGTCHGETLPARWEKRGASPVLVVIAKGCVQMYEMSISFGAKKEP